ncbi:hypothetical protein [uncultured Nocardioides sp.]|uniref:hypothetical protein n=1 Tax=uncultured Nocardioides sp. TaxID=198441 RepID=UPI002628AFD8|nr:hypothetical protein [uncultured Nocardioides sp.]
MTSPPDFDAFYAEGRHRLLVQTWALTGDLPASRRAVRDAYVAAWHRWRKVSRHEDPESAVRPQAWASALRRSTTRPWHRERGLDDEVRATLEALAKLSLTQRKVLILTHQASRTLPEIAQELGLVLATVERELQSATANLSLHRGVPSTSVSVLFEPLSAAVEKVRWPRVTIVRRAGTTRRRLHVAAGAALTTGALVASGVLVTDQDGLRPSLETERLAGITGGAGARQAADRDPGLEPARLLGREQVARLSPDRPWRMRDTSDNTTGDGLVLPCQSARYADPDGDDALVRQFRSVLPEGEEQAGAPRIDVTQLVEMSRSEDEARAAYRTTARWFAACGADRVQLLATEKVSDVGEQATLFVLRSYDDPVTTHTVTLARSGRTVSTLARSVQSDADPVREPLTTLLATAVNGLCGLDGTGRCAGPPSSETTEPLSLGGPAGGMLGTLDLPPVADVDQPWVATDPAPADVNVAATSCDETDFSAEPITDDVTRTFLVPEGDLPDEFGLTETVGLFPRDVGAQDFVAGVRGRMDACEEDQLGSEVELILDESDDTGQRLAWRVTTELSEDRTVEFLMGFVRNGRAVGQVGYVPAGTAVDQQAFTDLVTRAQVRLGATKGL